MMNKPISGDTYRRTNAFFEELRVRALATPNMTVRVNEGCATALRWGIRA